MRLYAYLTGLLALIGSGLALWFGGRRSGEAKHKVKTLETDAETRERMDKADEDIIHDDPAILRDWMRERGRK